MLQEVRRTGKPFDPMKLEAGCLQVRAHCLHVYNVHRVNIVTAQQLLNGPAPTP